MQIDGYSLDAQKARMKAYADFNDYQIVGEYEDTRAKKQAIETDKITGDNIYKVLVCFEKLYNVMNPLERKKLMAHLISEIQIYPERQPNGQWLKSIKFRLPIIESVFGQRKSWRMCHRTFQGQDRLLKRDTLR